MKNKNGNKSINNIISGAYRRELRISRILEFLPSKTQIVEKLDFNGKPSKKVQFIVIDVEDADRREKIFELSRMHVAKIYEELKKGKTVLEISRSGSAKDTRYFTKVLN